MATSTWAFSQQYYADFQAAKAALLAKIEAARSSGSPPSADVVQALSGELARLSKSLSGATGSLPSFEQRQAVSQVKSMEAALEGLRSSALSASAGKFSFKRKEKATPMPTPPSKPAPKAKNEEGTDDAKPTPPTHLTISGQKNRHIRDAGSLPSDVARGLDLSVSDLDGCIVDLAVLGSTLSIAHLRRLRNTVVLLPSVEGSVMLQDIDRCIISVAGCHQFRIHDSHRVDVYLFTTSHPIIENCSDIRFGAHPRTGSDSGMSMHEDVRDFSHIRSTPSPNWSIMPHVPQVSDADFAGLLEERALEDTLMRLLPS